MMGLIALREKKLKHITFFRSIHLCSDLTAIKLEWWKSCTCCLRTSGCRFRVVVGCSA